MLEWNERIEQAKKTLRERVRSDQGYGVQEVQIVYSDIAAVLDALKESEQPLKVQLTNCEAEGNSSGDFQQKPLVRHPDGRVWWTTLEGPELFSERGFSTHAHRMTSAEAFRPGAFVERKYNDGGIFSGRVNFVDDDMVSIFCGGRFRTTMLSKITLIKPAPEEKSHD